jgi:hypothetical protein
MARVVGFAVCLGAAGSPGQAEAQPIRSMDSPEGRSIAMACGRTGSFRNCVAVFRGKFAWVADAVLAELQTPPAPPTAANSTDRATRSEPLVVWDGTFAHPNARKFYTLKSYVPTSALTSQEACDQLPDPLKDRQRLLRLMCEADEELIAAGANRWPEERKELSQLRTLLASCLPPTSPNSNPCATP